MRVLCAFDTRPWNEVVLHNVPCSRGFISCVCEALYEMARIVNDLSLNVSLSGLCSGSAENICTFDAFEKSSPAILESFSSSLATLRSTPFECSLAGLLAALWKKSTRVQCHPSDAHLLSPTGASVFLLCPQGRLGTPAAGPSDYLRGLVGEVQKAFAASQCASIAGGSHPLEWCSIEIVTIPTQLLPAAHPPPAGFSTPPDPSSEFTFPQAQGRPIRVRAWDCPHPACLAGAAVAALCPALGLTRLLVAGLKMKDVETGRIVSHEVPFICPTPPDMVTRPDPHRVRCTFRIPKNAPVRTPGTPLLPPASPLCRGASRGVVAPIPAQNVDHLGTRSLVRATPAHLGTAPTMCLLEHLTSKAVLLSLEPKGPLTHFLQRRPGYLSLHTLHPCEGAGPPAAPPLLPATHPRGAELELSAARRTSLQADAKALRALILHNLAWPHPLLPAGYVAPVAPAPSTPQQPPVPPGGGKGRSHKGKPAQAQPALQPAPSPPPRPPEQDEGCVAGRFFLTGDGYHPAMARALYVHSALRVSAAPPAPVAPLNTGGEDGPQPDGCTLTFATTVPVPPPRGRNLWNPSQPLPPDRLPEPLGPVGSSTIVTPGALADGTCGAGAPQASVPPFLRPAIGGPAAPTGDRTDPTAG
ncbi:hypothetical protein PAPYR_1201 [Paratrimastix pyriformis]|uniref:Mediator of RNA polymerase II transcription subunit 25 n=1 Tax=Paratrimastix pyriformis TaxID=342808 RepID=A0ABQ8UU31_9EUKA|nr:hypothetical protein PAPYR_1201 [Paratrimastix pyriformis]